MLGPQFPTAKTLWCLLALGLNLSGCGAICDILLKSSESRDEAACTDKCAVFKERDRFVLCVARCRSDRVMDRSGSESRKKKDGVREEETEKKQAELDKRLTDKIFKSWEKRAE
ncbi:MAG: hypothetical protein V2B18_10335 [Pseudomonadota bacterium]